MEELKNWLHNFTNQMTTELIKSITSNHNYIDAFNASLNN